MTKEQEAYATEQRKLKMVRVETRVPGVGWQIEEFNGCPLSLLEPGRCPLLGNKCNFGLTEIRPPSCCPMRIGKVYMTYRLVSRTVEEPMER